MIELLNLTKIYHSDNEGSLALKGITLKFPETGFVAITGESGSGKTTLLNVLSGFASYEEGTMTVDGVDFSTFSNEDIETYRKNDIGFIFQDYHLIESHTVLDNLIEALLIIGVSYKAAKKKSLEYLEKYGLIEQKNNKAREISSGQKQKLAIARALIKEPKIILCDEPTANLDVESGKIIFGFLKEYAADHLVIVTTHNYEDAQEFVTHFVRLYKGNLTSYEQVKPISDLVPSKKDNPKTIYSRLSFISLKSQKVANIFKMVFSSVLVILSLLMAALFSGNIDDSVTKIVSREVFNNVNQNEMLIMKKDGEFINDDDLSSLNDIDGIVGTQLYGLATEMNYYYRQDIDYGYDIVIKQREKNVGGDVITEEYTDYEFKTLKDDLYIKSYVGMIKESDLSEGTLPINHYDIVASSDYHVGDVITIYFNDRIFQGYSFFQFDFTVVGILKEKIDDVYFSDGFIKSIDYIQYNSKYMPLTMQLTYTVIDKYTRVEKQAYTFYEFEPLYDPNLGPNEVTFSEKFISAAKDSFPALDKIFIQTITLKNDIATSYRFTFSEQFTDSNLPAFCIFVGENIYHKYIDTYKSKISRVVIEDYSQIDEVARSLTNLNYDCLSEYRSASTGVDADKQDRRAITLIVSMFTLMAAAIIYYVFNFFIERARLSSDNTLYLLGSSKKSINQSSLIQIAIVQLCGLILGIVAYLLLSLLPIAFIKETNLYLRYYHFLIISGAVVILTFLLWLKYRQDFLRYKKKGGNAQLCLKLRN